MKNFQVWTGLHRKGFYNGFRKCCEQFCCLSHQRRFDSVLDISERNTNYMELLRKLCRRYTKSYLEFSGKVETTIEDSVFTACCVQLWFCTIWWLDIKWAWAEPSQNPPWTISLGDSRANNWALQMGVSGNRCELWQREKINCTCRFLSSFRVLFHQHFSPFVDLNEVFHCSLLIF